METKVFFVEKQKFKQKWVWILLGAINLVFFYGIIKQLYFKIPFGNNPTGDKGLIISTLLFLVFCFLFSRICLTTIISEHSITIQLNNFKKIKKTINWEDVASCEIRKYKPILEYGGWGIRFGMNGMAYNMYGNMGIQLTLKSGSKILIGTNESELISPIIKEINESTLGRTL